ncbi:MFS transporter [Halovenus sp. WSH3]|uniref:MFS transporter n=1 Tax=Halovenus carboxidivorans TaxID=2692199 RepID=A0A6B0TB90_9EURY|nr:glycosyltransferase family 39 protein [Halovenus carboxidivorans]MXR50449.1 MFS transporter [Halovenus carboxidivorans]
MTDSERVEGATRSFLDDHPEHEDTLETLLAHQKEHGSWEFDDAPIDSGAFGELVSRPFVEEADDDYRFADRHAVERALAGDDADAETTASTELDLDLDIAFPAPDRRALAGLLAVLAVVVAARSLFFGSVFRDGLIVSPANDPYFYRYWQSRLLAESSGAFDAGMTTTVGELTRIRPLTHALNWWFADLFGAPALVAAVTPIVASLLLALCLYGLTRRLTADRRIALAAVLLLALTPVHVVYTQLGFLEHRPYQYLWIGLQAYTLGWLAVDVLDRHSEGADDPGLAHAREPRSWAVAGLLAVAVAALAHTWGGSPLSFVPIAVYVGFRVVADHREGIDPLFANAPALAGIAVGSLLAFGIHRRCGWHEAIAATIPLGVAAGAVGVAVLAHLWLRADLPTAGLLGAEGVFAVVAAFLFRRLRPDDVARLQERSDAFFNRETATETASLFNPEQAFIFTPVGQIGLGFYLALPVLAVATYYVARNYEPGWLAAVCFAYFYLVIAAVQVRFAAQFGIFCALFGAVGLVYLLSAVDLARPVSPFDRERPAGPTLELPDTPTVGAYLAGAVVLVLLLNLIFVPSLLAQTRYSEEKIEAVQSIDDRSERLNQSYPNNFVLSEWGENRMYNYFVNGESSGYGYARNVYERFISDTNPDAYFNQFNNRVGYIALTDIDAPEQTVQSKLFEDFGAGNDSTAHYQLIYSGESVRAFAVVDGAVIQTQAEPGTNVTARTTVDAAGERLDYKRTATADDSGTARIRVAYPGEYDLGNTTVSVPASAVRRGATVSPGSNTDG